MKPISRLAVPAALVCLLGCSAEKRDSHLDGTVLPVPKAVSRETVIGERMHNLWAQRAVYDDSMEATADLRRKSGFFTKIEQVDSTYLSLVRSPGGHEASRMLEDETFAQSCPLDRDRLSALEDSVILDHADNFRGHIQLDSFVQPIGAYSVSGGQYLKGGVPMVVTTLSYAGSPVISDTSFVVTSPHPDIISFDGGIASTFYVGDGGERFMVRFIYDEGKFKAEKGFSDQDFEGD